ncbi:unnamed protein product, partial [Iphiclides podalirius]
MDVMESEWVSKAIDNVDKYLHRGGRCQGDNPQLLGGTDLLNTIGMAMGLPMKDPSSWSDRELQLALNNQLVYFEGEAREAIDVIAAQIRSCCEGDDKNFVTVIPVELYFNSKLYELPVFRVQRYKDSHKYFVDNIGRSYNSFSDWYQNSKLPPCKMAYPYNLQLMLRPGYDYSRVLVDYTPFARSDHKAVRAIDTVSAVAGIGSGVGLLFASGGLAAPLVITGVASAIWGTARSGAQLADKTLHGESVNPFSDSESRMLWLGIAANLVSFGAMGASMRLTSLAIKGQSISNAFRVFVNVANGTNVAMLIASNLQSHELDRLYTFKSTVDTFKASPYMREMMHFVSERNPKSVSEIVAYCEFVVKYVETEKLLVEKKLRNGTLTLPINVKKSEWTRKKATEVVFHNPNAMLQKFRQLTDVVTRCEMVGIEVLPKNLSDTELVAALRRIDVKFGSTVSAAYHVFKHPTDPLEAYIIRANSTLRSAEQYSVTLTQDGDARTVRFEGASGSCVILERDGRVLLCTFTPKIS